MSQGKGKDRSGPETTQKDALGGSLLPQPEELYTRERLTKMQGSRELGNGFKFWDLNDDTLREEDLDLDFARDEMSYMIRIRKFVVPGSLWKIWLVGKDSNHAHPTVVVFNKDTGEARKRLAESRSDFDFMSPGKVGYLVLDRRPEHYLKLKTTVPVHPPRYTIIKEPEYGGPALRISIPTKDGHERIATMGGFIEAPDGIQGKAGIYGLTIASAFEDWRIEEERSEVQQKPRSPMISEEDLYTARESESRVGGAGGPRRTTTVEEQKKVGPRDFTKRTRTRWDKFHGWIAIESNDYEIARKPNIVELRDNLDETLVNPAEEELRATTLWIQTTHGKVEALGLIQIASHPMGRGYYLAAWLIRAETASLRMYKSLSLSPF
jgi:hypothetical protein